MNTGEGLADAAARAEGEGPKHDTAVYWFSCTHKRQVQKCAWVSVCLTYTDLWWWWYMIWDPVRVMVLYQVSTLTRPALWFATPFIDDEDMVDLPPAVKGAVRIVYHRLGAGAA